LTDGAAFGLGLSDDGSTRRTVTVAYLALSRSTSALIRTFIDARSAAVYSAGRMATRPQCGDRAGQAEAPGS
jgi:hypothetical protein